MGKSNIRFRDAKGLYFVDESEVLTVECSLAKGSIGLSLAIDDHPSFNLPIDLYDGLATIPVGDILRAAGQRNRSNPCFITITATCDGVSATMTARCVFCRRFSDDESVIFSSWLCSCGSQKVTYRSAPEILPFLADPSAATQSALIRISFLDGTSSDYTFADLRNMTVDGLDVSPKAVAEFASGKGVKKEIVSYDLWIIRESSSGARTTGKPCSFKIAKDRIERVTYKFLNQKGAFEYIHASGELRRSIDARTKTFISPGSESELSNDSSVIMEQNAGHIGSRSGAATWLDFLSSSRRYVVDKSMAEHLIVVEDNKSETLDFGVGEISFRWRYGAKSVSRADSATVPLESLRQRCDSVINTPLNRVRIDVDYEPSYTNQRGVIWRIVDGSEFVSLNSDGILRVKEGAHGSRVTILAQSVHDGSITDLKSYTVSYNTQAPSYPMTIEANVESPVVDLIIDDSEVDYEDGILVREGQIVTLRVSKSGYNTQSRSFEFSATEKSQYFYLVRHFQSDDYVSESTVKALISEGLSSLDWFFDESYEKDGETKRRLKLNPRYQGMYAEGWISSGLISESSGQTNIVSLSDLTDVDDDLYKRVQTGYALVWDGARFTAGPVAPGTQVTEETVAGWGFTKNEGTVTGIKLGLVSYSPENGVVTLPEYPTTLPASDVPAWAKKPSLAASDIPALSMQKISGLQTALSSKADSSALSGYIPKGGLSAADNTSPGWGTLTEANGYSSLLHWASSDGGDLNVAAKGGKIFVQLDGCYYQNEGRCRVLDSSDIGTSVASNASLSSYLPLSGGTMSNTDVVKNLNADRLDGFDATYFATASGLASTNIVLEAANAKITTLQSYFTNGAANSAIKLDTSRSIWGQQFDGTDNVDGILTLSYSSARRATGIEVTSTNEGEASIGFDSTNRTVFGRYPDRAFVWNSVNGEVITCLDNGNVGIDKTAPVYKLDVSGDMRATGRIYIGPYGGYLEVVNVGSESAPSYALRSTLPFCSDSWVSGAGVSAAGGGGGGSSYLHDLLDVDVTTSSPSDGNALVWDSLTHKWMARDITVDLSDYATISSLESYLPLTGGTMEGVTKMITGEKTRTSGAYLSFVHNEGGSEVRDADISANNSGLLGIYSRDGIVLRPGTGTEFDTSHGLSITASSITFNGISLKPKLFYGTCSTATTTYTKVVKCPSFTSSDLSNGTAIVVYMDNKLDYTGTVKLNVNGTGGLNIYTGFTSRKAWGAGEVVLFVYDSGYWFILPTWYYVNNYSGGGSGSGGSTVSVEQVATSGTKIATIKVDGVGTDIFAPQGSYTLPAATSGALGGIRIGYSQSGKNYPVLLDSNNRAYVNVPWSSGSGGSTVSVAQGDIKSLTDGALVGTITVDGTAKNLYSPKVGVEQVNKAGIEIARIKIGSANAVSIFAPTGESGESGVQSVVGKIGDVTTTDIVNALAVAGYKLSSYVTNSALNTALSGYATTSSLRTYLPLSAGNGNALTGSLYSRAIIPTANETYDLGTSAMRYNNIHINRVYLADGVYIYYDTTNNCIRTNAPIVSDSYITSGKTATT